MKKQDAPPHKNGSGDKHRASTSAAPTKQSAAGKVAAKRDLTKAKKCTAPGRIAAEKGLNCIGKKNDMPSGRGKVVAKGLGIHRRRRAQPVNGGSVSTPSQQQQQLSSPETVLASAPGPSSGRKRMYTGTTAGLFKIRYKDGKDGIEDDKQKLEAMEAKARVFFGEVDACINKIDCIDLTMLGFQILGKGLQEFALAAAGCEDGGGHEKHEALGDSSTSGSDPEDMEDDGSSSSSSEGSASCEEESGIGSEDDEEDDSDYASEGGASGSKGGLCGGRGGNESISSSSSDDDDDDDDDGEEDDDESDASGSSDSAEEEEDEDDRKEVAVSSKGNTCKRQVMEDSCNDGGLRPSKVQRTSRAEEFERESLADSSSDEEECSSSSSGSGPSDEEDEEDDDDGTGIDNSSSSSSSSSCDGE
jgi:hypothetical protein